MIDVEQRTSGWSIWRSTLLRSTCSTPRSSASWSSASASSRPTKRWRRSCCRETAGASPPARRWPSTSRTRREGMLTAPRRGVPRPARPSRRRWSPLVHGACLGRRDGADLVLRLRGRRPDATFGQPEIKLAFFPPVARPSAAPPDRATRTPPTPILTGENLTAERALAMGLVQKILPKDQWGEIDDLFNGPSRRCSASPSRRSRKGLTEGCAERSTPSRPVLSELYRLEDVAEGIKSFEERRPPEWKHPVRSRQSLDSLLCAVEESATSEEGHEDAHAIHVR